MIWENSQCGKEQTNFLNVEKIRTCVLKTKYKVQWLFEDLTKRKKAISHNICKRYWCSFRWSFNLVSLSLTCPNWWNSTEQLIYLASSGNKQTFLYWKQNTILYLALIFFEPVSYGVETKKKHIINFELSKIKHLTK